MTWNTPESDEEREAREAREAELQAERDRQEAERKVAREKMTILSEMRSALDVYTRVMRWSTEHYSRPMDYTPEKQAEELEIAAWRIQGQGELMREAMPELFWPKGTPVTGRGGVYMRPERLQALKLDLEATAESINDALTDLVEEDEDEFEDEALEAGMTDQDDFSDDPGAHTSHRNPTDVTRYADASMYPAPPMRATLPKVTVITATPDPLGVIAAVCRMYKGQPFYDASDFARITDDERREAWQDMSQTTLDTPLEFIKLHFLVEGVTRALTHQMVRQRTAVYAQESLRFAVKDDVVAACQMPPSIAMLPRRDERRLTWQRAMADAQLWYHTLIENGIPAEDARSVLPHAVTTRLHYATDLRNLRREVAKRTCTQAQFEWRHLVTSMREALGAVDDQWKIIARDLVKPPCFAAGHCTFNASFDRPCTIKDRVDRGEFDQIDELEYLADPRAAWDMRDE